MGRTPKEVPYGCIDWYAKRRNKALKKLADMEQDEKDLLIYRQTCSKVPLFNSLMGSDGFPSMDLAMVYMIGKEFDILAIWANINKKFGKNCDIICMGSDDGCPEDCTAIYFYCANFDYYCESLENFAKDLVRAHNGEIMLKNGKIIDNASKS